jgi:zinc transporter ZupT
MNSREFLRTSLDSIGSHLHWIYYFSIPSLNVCFYRAHSELNNQEATSFKPWGHVIGATLLVNCAALTGLLLLLLPAMRKGLIATSEGESHGKWLDIIIPSFAVGALMATTVFLVVPEALHHIEGAHGIESGDEDHSGHGHRLLQDEHDDHEEDNAEGVNAAKLGCGILGGFLLPIFLSILFHRDEKAEEDESALPADEEECASCMGDEDVENGAAPQDRGSISAAVVIATKTKTFENGAAPQDRGSISAAVVISPNDSAVYDADASVDTFKDKGPPVDPIATKTKTFIDYRLGSSILIGDAFHNFADGLFIGAAFLSCSWATAFSITAITLFHEMAQELADFILLTRFVGLSVFQAASLNFVSGLWVCLGGIIVLAAKPSDEAIGIMLAFAGGVYINIAACESLPRVERSIKDRNDRALTFFSIIVGTIPIGLILLDHKHC